ncbi:MAG: hypothetical protein AAFR03_12775 [Pseudomonadota bacterium]
MTDHHYDETGDFNESPFQADQFEAQGELDSANQMIRANEVGRTAGFVFPFSSQLKRDTARQFEADKLFYRTATKTQFKVLAYYFGMRASGLAAFFGFLYCFDLFARHYFLGAEAVVMMPNLVEQVFAGSPLGSTLTALAAVALASIIVRYFLRVIFFLFIDVQAHQLSFHIKQRVSDIVSRITECCAYSQVRRGNGLWSSRGKNWIKVAIWNAKRAEYLDRFASTITWLIQFYVNLMEWIANVVMVAASTWVAAHIVTRYHLFSDVEAVRGSTFDGIIMAVILGLTVFIGWIFLFRRKGDFWTEKFRTELVEAETAAPHYFDQVSSVVENLIEMVVANERNSASRTNSSTT